MLDRALRAATDVNDAATAVVRHLHRPTTSPSVFLARGTRLRLQAEAGHEHVLDGLPSAAGLVGRAFRTGEAVVVDDLAGDPAALGLSPATVGSVCVPVRCWGAVVGALSIDHRAPVAPEDVIEAVAAAEALGAELERLGHVTTESPAQRLVRHAVRLGELTEAGEIHAEAVAAACAVAGMESAALFLDPGTGTLTAAEAVGPLADALGLAPAAVVDDLAALVASGASWYALEPAGAAARAEGAQALVALGLSIGSRRGLLLVADRSPRTPATETVELLELLTTHCASSLRTAAALAELRTRATTDPLTGLGHHATFHDALARARDRREGIAVLLTDLDGFKSINDTRGHQAGDRVLRETAAALSSALRRGDELFRIGGDEFAAIIRVRDGQEALETGRRLRDAVVAGCEVTVSIGVAVPAPSESDAAVLARADTALYAVKAGGRDGVQLHAA